VYWDGTAAVLLSLVGLSGQEDQDRSLVAGENSWAPTKDAFFVDQDNLKAVKGKL